MTSRSLRARGASRWLGLFVLIAVTLLAVAPLLASPEDIHADTEAHAEGGHGPGLGDVLPLWSAIPFVGILLSIALFPLFAPHWWHKHFPQVSLFWALALAIPFLFVYRGQAVHDILHIYFLDYIPFIILLWALFTVSGGILIKGTLKGSPVLNVTLLLIGTAMASWIGTTGASMIMIRPLLRANAWRQNKVHVVIFFIFLVSNIGGSLTPLGDPPLFLGFLHSVPFFWTFHLFAPMMLLVVPLLAIFFAIDTLLFRREQAAPVAAAAPVTANEPLKVEGLFNLIFLAGIVGAVLMSGFWKAGTFHLLGIELKVEFLLRDVLMIVLGMASLRLTADAIHKGNEFSWFPIKEVAILFAGIFMTIIPALAILKAGEHGALSGLIAMTETPLHYFWITGGLSAFLDNAPTYLTFFNTALGSFYAGIPEHEAVAELIATHHVYLLAISTGAVFMGAMTYIGNAPNFMVKSIAEEAGIRMPSFFGYLIKWSIPILIPLLVIVTLVFFL